jgi:hypothetical protein
MLALENMPAHESRAVVELRDERRYISVSENGASLFQTEVATTRVGEI